MLESATAEHIGRRQYMEVTGAFFFPLQKKCEAQLLLGSVGA
jgi:hypothetical protein